MRESEPIGKPVWVRVMAGLADALDYDNFKSEAARFLGPKGAAYEDALHDVWSVMYRCQTQECDR